MTDDEIFAAIGALTVTVLGVALYYLAKLGWRYVKTEAEAMKKMEDDEK